jgi:hypothetical protein
MESETKHLEFIQGVINRHNSNSFMIKGWTITIVTAILAYATNTKDANITLMALIPICMFWILDSIFLANERCFISLYNACISDNKLTVENRHLLRKYRVETAENKSSNSKDSKIFIVLPFSMNFIQFRQIKRNNWFNVAFSSTILWYYIMLFVVTFVLYFRIEYKSNAYPSNIKTKNVIKNQSIPKLNSLGDTIIRNK